MKPWPIVGLEMMQQIPETPPTEHIAAERDASGSLVETLLSLHPTPEQLRIIERVQGSRDT